MDAIEKAHQGEEFVRYAQIKGETVLTRGNSKD
jgi:hypothetical protein